MPRAGVLPARIAEPGDEQVHRRPPSPEPEDGGYSESPESPRRRLGLAALGTRLGRLRSLGCLGLRGFFLGRRPLGLRDAREHRVRLADVGDARDRGQVAEQDRVADAERRDVDLDVLGQIARQRLERELVGVLREDAAVGLDAFGLTREDDRDRRLDRAVHAHLEQVEVLQGVAQRVQLHVLDEGVDRRARARHLDLEDRVASAGRGQRLAQMTALDRECERLAPVAVEHARDLARAAERAYLRGPTDLTCLELEHDCLLALIHGPAPAAPRKAGSRP